MMVAKAPTQIGMRLPLGLRLWVELKAQERQIPTSTLIRQWIEAEARRELPKLQESASE